jgi:ABC-type nitrate/sulfonate/bicarbonate transport system permease component
MVLPATAIDEKMSLLDALAFTKNYKLLSLFMVTIFPTIIAILIALVYGLIIGFLTGVVSSHLSILYVFLNVFITVLVISCLSVTYSYIKNEINEKALKDKYIE